MAHFPNDHGLYTDLSADDHPQYQTDADGDARYPRRDGSGSSGQWPISITGNAGTAGYANSSSYANYASSLDSQVWNWSDAGLQTYFWGSSDAGNCYVTWEGNWARAGHNHAGKYGWVFGLAHFDAGSLAAATAYGPWTVGHGLQGNAPKMSVATGTYDDGVHSIVTSIGNLWDGTNVLVTARNVASSAESCFICVVSWV